MPPRLLGGIHHGIRRPFSSNCTRNAMAYIGKSPVIIPPSVTVTPLPSSLQVEGPLGAISIPTEPFITISHTDLNEPHKSITLQVEDGLVKKQRQMWGTTRTLIHNAVVGVSDGHSVPVHLVGVGYRAALEPDPRPSPSSSGERLNLKLGFSHAVFVPIPKDIKVTVPGPTRIELFCTDKQKLGQFAANIRSLRRPEPYKGKGVFVGLETIRLKNAKKR